MATRLRSSNDLPHHAHWWHMLCAWERAALVVVLLGALILSAALIYFRPTGDSSARPGTRNDPAAATAGPEFPPGTRWYYQRGQWVPQDQQP